MARSMLIGRHGQLVQRGHRTVRGGGGGRVPPVVVPGRLLIDEESLVALFVLFLTDAQRGIQHVKLQVPVANFVDLRT